MSISRKQTHMEKLFDKFGARIVLIGNYTNSQTKVRYSCDKGHVFLKTPASILVQKYGCNQCGGIKERITTEDYEIRLKEVHGESITCIDRYINARTYIRHLCSKGHVFKNSPDHLLNGRTCPTCVYTIRSNPRSHCDYVSLVANINSNIEILGKYKNSSTKILHKCLVCTHVWKVLPPSILLGRGCPACAIEKRNNSNVFYAFKDYIYDDCTVFKIQGNEKFALDLLKKQGYQSKDLTLGAGKTPVIRYTMRGKNKIHFPDIYIEKENRIIEVKSLYTFIGVSSKAGSLKLFDKNRAKFTQATKEGYKYEFWLFNRRGKIINLPKNWYLKSGRSIERSLKEKQ